MHWHIRLIEDTIMNRRMMPPLVGRRGMSRRSNVYATLLLLQLADRILRMDPKPPVTVTIIALNLFIFYFKSISSQLSHTVVTSVSPVLSLFSVRAACLNPSAVVNGQLSRLLLSSFIHLSDIHVLFNSMSFLYKGVTLEAVFGSYYFLALIVYLSIAAHALYVAIAVIASHLGEGRLMHNCVAGFSGVIFGLKVILNANPQYGQTATRIFGLPFPGGVAPWTELFIVSALMPNSSFLGHLCGILAGLLYVYVPKMMNRVPIRISTRLRSPTRSYRPFQGRPRRLHEE